MFFGERRFQNPKRGIPPSIQRQIFFQVLLLAVVVGLAFAFTQAFRQGKGGPERLRAHPIDGEAAARLEKEIAEKLGPPVPPGPPEPFVERPEILREAAARDRTRDEEGGVVTEEAVVYLAHKIRALGEAFARQEPALSTLRGDRVWDELLTHPDLYRGQLVEIHGNLFATAPGRTPLELRGLPYPNPSGIDRVFRAYVYNKDANKFFLVYTIEKAREYRHLDAVVFRGYFARLYTGDVVIKGQVIKNGGTIPLLVGKDFRLLPRPKRPDTDVTRWIPLAVSLPLLAFLVIFVLSYRSRKDYERRRREARRRLKERQAPPPEA